MKKIATVFIVLSLVLLSACSVTPESGHLELELSEEQIAQLVDETNLEYYDEFSEYKSLSDPAFPAEFPIIATTIHDYYAEKNKLKIFITTDYAYYNRSENIVTLVCGGTVPGTLVYIEDSSGKFFLEKYLEAEDGETHVSSIKKYCTTPVSGKTIEGLASRIIENSYDSELHRQKLIDYLNEHNLKGISLREYPEAELIPLT